MASASDPKGHTALVGEGDNLLQGSCIGGGDGVKRTRGGPRAQPSEVHERRGYRFDTEGREPFSQLARDGCGGRRWGGVPYRLWRRGGWSERTDQQQDTPGRGGEREDDGERERLVDAVSEGVRETLSEAVAV